MFLTSFSTCSSSFPYPLSLTSFLVPSLFSALHIFNFHPHPFLLSGLFLPLFLSFFLSLFSLCSPFFFSTCPHLSIPLLYCPISYLTPSPLICPSLSSFVPCPITSSYIFPSFPPQILFCSLSLLFPLIPPFPFF
ncbi:Hypothetical predicted protein [Xyrichtys novacula]|uniref:Uncharacterized protein n=1 Tax=Xyrichtys novacula TaxID=13765 RepID=A0AAV1GN66_XYRNO|nr:Hypothetical predicted protein [Xyrichtys novacula]